LAVFAFNAYRLTDGQGGVPLDDAWIHFQFARNLARGDGFAFNPGQPTAGSTAPMWTLLLAGAYALGGRFPLAGQILSAACFLMTLVATYALAKRLTGRRFAAWLAGTAVALNGRMVWAGLSALETPLFAGLSLLAIGSHLSDRSTGRYRARTASLFGLAALARPAGYLLFGLALADLALRAARVRFRDSGSARDAARAILRRFPFLPVLLFAAMVLPYAVFSRWVSGHLLPNTFSAKTAFNWRPDLDFVSLWARYLILDNPILLPFFVLGVGVLVRRARLLSGWTVGLPLVYAFLHAELYQHGRYLIPLIPCDTVVGIIGLVQVASLTLRGGSGWLSSRNRPAVAIGLLLLIGTAWRLPTMAQLYARNVDDINTMHVSIGRWVELHTDTDALLALNDIGAITYLSQREVVDLAGLVTPEVVPLLRAPDRASRLAELMAERSVDYVIIFPNWFPGLARRDDVLESAHQVTLKGRTITGGEMMVVYRARWSGQDH
jgi:hypothetical protein